MATMRIWAALALFVSACAGEREDAVAVTMATEEGDIEIMLYPDKAPLTVANFLTYVDEGQFDGAYFYRVTRPDNDPMIDVIQGGLWSPFMEDGDDDFAAPHPPIAHETTQQTGLTHVNGAISMARGEPGSASSEFFISVGPNPELDFAGARNPDGQGFAVFGQVTLGMEVVQAIHRAPTREGEGFEGQLLISPVKINTVSRR